MKRLFNLSIAIILLLGMLPATAAAKPPAPRGPRHPAKSSIGTESVTQGPLLQTGAPTAPTDAIDVLLVAADEDTIPASGLTWERVTEGASPYIPPHGGAFIAKLNSYSAYGAVRLQTGALDLSGVSNPQLSFWMSHDFEYEKLYDNIRIQVSTDGTNWTNAGFQVMRADPGCVTACWQQHIFNLSAYAYSNSVYIGFLGDSMYGMNIFLDDVEILDGGTPILQEGFEDAFPPAGWSQVEVPWEGGYVERILHSYGDIGAVDRFDAYDGTPILDDLTPYDVVLTWSYSNYDDPTGLGNVLADYVDAGGKVINLAYSMEYLGNQVLSGRFVSENYPAMWGSNNYAGTPCLGEFEADHRIMNGIPSLCNPPDNYALMGLSLTTGSSAVAYWDDGELFVAAKDNRTVVSINGYVGMWQLWDIPMYDLIHNAIQWLLPSPSDPELHAEDAFGGTSNSDPNMTIDIKLVVRAKSVLDESGSNYNCPNIYFSIAKNPAHGTVNTNGGSGSYCGEEGYSTEQNISYTPDATYAGADSFYYQVWTYDRTYVSGGNFTIRPNQPPNAPDAAAAVNYWFTGDFTFRIPPDPDGDEMSLVGVNQEDTTNGTVSSGNNVYCYEEGYCYVYFNYTPPSPLPDPSSEAEIHFTYQLSDGADLSNWGNGTLKVGDVPQATDDFRIAANNYQNWIFLRGNDGTDGELAFRLISNPAHGNFSDPLVTTCPATSGPSGIISSFGLPEKTPERLPYKGYSKPNQSPSAATESIESIETCAVVNYNPYGGYNGEDSLTFVTNDGIMDSLPATVKLYVQQEVASTASNVISAITPDQISNYPVPIILNAYDPNVVMLDFPGYPVGDDLSFNLFSQAAHGTVSILGVNCDISEQGESCYGFAEYTPNDPETWAGDSFAFKVHDGYLDSNMATVTLIPRDTPAELTVNASDDLVDTVCDATHCSLREAVESSIAGDSITFDLATPATISLQQGRIQVAHDLSITGPGADQLAISGSEKSGVFEFYDGFSEQPISSSLSGVTVKDGREDLGGGVANGPKSTLLLEDCAIGPNNIVTYAGGGIYNYGNLTVNRCTVAGNHGTGSEGGAGIYTSEQYYEGASGSLTLVNSTVSGNVTNNIGGGIYAYAGDVSLIHTTVTGNLANQNYLEEPWGGGGGMFISNSSYTSLTIQNSLIAGNTDLSPQLEHIPWPDLYVGAEVPVTSLGGNLIGDDTGSFGWVGTDLVGTAADPIDPMLDVLALNAPGTTMTHALLEGSPAIDAAACIAEVTVDQRGAARPQGAACDIGAFELGGGVAYPNTTITAQPADPSISADASFEFGSSVTGSTFECQLDAGGFSGCTSPQSYTALADGSHTFEVKATDGGGNTDPTPASFTWTIDTQAPDTSLTANPPNPSNSASASFSFTSEAGAIFQCQLDAVGFSGCTSPQTYTGLSDGSHTFEVKATDAAGNTDPTPASFTWTVDTVAPIPNITSNPTDPSNSASASFSFISDEAGSSFECQLDGGDFAACTSPKTYTALADGSHTFVVTAIDIAGNTGATSSFTWTIDTAAPDTTITASPANPSGSPDASFSFTSEPGATFQCQLDSAAYSSCTSPKAYMGLTDGSHTFRVRATDGAGNTDPTPASFTWTISVSKTLFVSAIGITLKDGRTHTLNAVVTIKDYLNALLNKVVVTVQWAQWNGSQFVVLESRVDPTGTTNRSGEAKFTLRGLAPGTFRLCVTNAVKPGYTYSPDDNVEDCQEIVIP